MVVAPLVAWVLVGVVDDVVTGDVWVMGGEDVVAGRGGGPAVGVEGGGGPGVGVEGGGGMTLRLTVAPHAESGVPSGQHPAFVQ